MHCIIPHDSTTAKPMTMETLPPQNGWLRPRDQAVVVAGIVIATCFLVGDWLTGGGTLQRQVELDAKKDRLPVFSVDINVAGWPEIAQLPGIGETLARRIVESREREGRFRSLADLRRVRGIGKNTLARIEPYLRQP